MKYRYVKEQKTLQKQVVSNLSYLLLVVGAVMLFWSFYPVISFELYSKFFIQQNVITPIAQSKLNTQQNNSVLGSVRVLSSNLRDFTQAHLWFPSKQQSKTIAPFATKEYNLSIPKINIVKAIVTVGGEDLSKSLVHYLPKSMPGEDGNVAIFGHSTLPQLFNVNDYKSIFTYLPSLQKGDKIIIESGDITYQYEVFDMFVVNPDNVSILEQKFDAPYITLVTCVPPGTFWKRLVVRGKLVTM